MTWRRKTSLAQVKVGGTALVQTLKSDDNHRMNKCCPDSSALFHGRHFDRVIIILCVRWYITYKLSYRGLVEMMDERGIDIAHTTILRWVQLNLTPFSGETDKAVS
jgi:hypothetical protein